MSDYQLYDPSILTIPQLLRAYEHRARKRFGQHFLSDANILEKICDVAGLEARDCALEIGPGCGPLTWTMLKRGALVRAIELDRDLVSFLEAAFPRDERFGLTHADALKVDLDEVMRGWPAGQPRRVIANLPYNVATEIFFKLSERSEMFDSMALMFQREVAQRMVAPAGSKVYGVLSLMTWLKWDARLAIELPPGAFSPPPKVHSAVVVCRPVRGGRFEDARVEQSFIRVVRTSFQQRRKQLLNSLKPLSSSLPEVFERAGLRGTERPEELDAATFSKIAHALVELG